jgi:tetratricopeptide (TPR) repeat protein
VIYLWRTIWPANLALFYPYPQSIPVWQSAGAGIFMVAVTSIAVQKGRQAPYFLVGWAWYFITLFPVIGLVQQGLWPAWADRFAYVPLIGPFIIIAWGTPALLPRVTPFQKPAFAAFVIAISALGLSSWHQIRHWSDSETLLTHAINVAPPNHLAHYNMGALLLSQGRTDEALSHYSRALKIMPRNPLFHHGLGTALLSLSKYDEAVHYLREALRLSPGNPEVLTNLGAALMGQGKRDEAMPLLLQALSNKCLPEAHHNLGLILAEQGRLREAVSHYERAMGLRPGDARILNDLAVALYSLGEYDKALVQLSEALKIDPGNPKYLHNLRSMRKQMEGSHKERETGRNP